MYNVSLIVPTADSRQKPYRSEGNGRVLKNVSQPRTLNAANYPSKKEKQKW